jgi:hypothetical protein
VSLNGAQADPETSRGARTVSTLRAQRGFENALHDFVEGLIEAYLNDFVVAAAG